MNQSSKKRTEITIETHEIKIIRISGEALRIAFCRRCESESAVFTPAQIAGFLGLSMEEICRMIGSDEYHLIENDETAALVCGNALKSERRKK